jgi:hypothetical protein
MFIRTRPDLRALASPSPSEQRSAFGGPVWPLLVRCPLVVPPSPGAGSWAGPGFPSIRRNQLVCVPPVLGRSSARFPRERNTQRAPGLAQVDLWQPSFADLGCTSQIPLNRRTGSNPTRGQGPGRMGTRSSGAVSKPGTGGRLAEATVQVSSNVGQPFPIAGRTNSKGAYRRLYQGSMLLFPLRANAHADRRRSPVWD